MQQNPARKETRRAAPRSAQQSRQATGPHPKPRNSPSHPARRGTKPSRARANRGGPKPDRSAGPRPMRVRRRAAGSPARWFRVEAPPHHDSQAITTVRRSGDSRLREPSRAGQCETAPAQLHELQVRAAPRAPPTQPAVDRHLAGQLVHRDERLVVAPAAPAVADRRVRVHRRRNAVVQPTAVRAARDAVGRVEVAVVLGSVFAGQRRSQQRLACRRRAVLRIGTGPRVVVAASALLGHGAPSGRVVRSVECDRGNRGWTTGKTLSFDQRQGFRGGRRSGLRRPCMRTYVL